MEQASGKSDEGELNIYWADLHNHNQIGYGKGTLERSYAIARNLLDVYAMTPHGHWPDPPGDDPGIGQYHQEGFARVQAMFGQVIEAANRYYEPGRFVTLIGFEWHSSRWGDYQVIFPDDEGTLEPADTLDELRSFARRHGAILVPHHVGYKRGWRGLDWDSWNPQDSPVVEIFSEHGNSLEDRTHWPMVGHSMGGTTRSQTGLHQLTMGKRFGLLGSSDNHDGHPAGFGEGITALLLPSLTREAVFAALKARHTYASTGERIGLKVRAGQATMGDVLTALHPRRLDINVDPLEPIHSVQMLRNGQRACGWHPPEPTCTLDESEYLVRINWGWDRLGGQDTTDWDIQIQLRQGRLLRIHPAFIGGAGSHELVNCAKVIDPQQAVIQSFTSRLNPAPISGAVLRLVGDRSTELELNVQTTTQGQPGQCRLVCTLDQLAQDDCWGQPTVRFSSPRLRIGRPYATTALHWQTTWTDPAPSAAGDFYLVKVQQTNGQVAWSSPIWFSDQPG